MTNKPHIHPRTSVGNFFTPNPTCNIHMHVDGGHRQRPIDFQRGHFQNGRLVAILDFFVSRL